MDPSKSERSNIPQDVPPPYLNQPGQPNAGYPPQGYPGQPIPQAQYGQVPYPGQPAIVVQPMAYVAPTPMFSPLPHYLGFSIFTMLCCCLPLGIAALVYSIFARNAKDSGQEEIAKKYSRMARNLNIAALVIGLIFIVVYIILIVTYNLRYRYYP